MVKMKYPVQSTSPPSQLEKDRELFLEKVQFFLESYWEPYEKTEQKELKNLGKRMKQKNPTTDIFPSGYTYSIDIKGKGNVYTKKDFISKYKRSTMDPKLSK